MTDKRIKTVGDDAKKDGNLERFTQPVGGNRKEKTIKEYLTDSIGKIEGQLNAGKLVLGNSHSIEELLLHRQQFDSQRQKRSKKYTNDQSRLATSRQGDVSSPGKELSPAEHKEFITKIIRQKKKLLKRLSRRAAEMQDQELRQSMQKSRNQQERRRQEVENRRKRIEASLSEMRIREESRISQLEQQNKKLKQIKSRKKLHQILEQKFEKGVILPQIQQNKQKLDEIRQAHKPIDLSLIRQHQSEYLLQIQRRQANSTKSRPSNRKYERPERLQRFLEQEKRDRSEELIAKKKELQQKIQRMQEYSQRLDQSFRPRIDLNKKREIQERLLREREDSLRIERMLEKDVREVGLKNLQYAKKKKINEEHLPRKETETTGANLQNSTVPSTTTKPREIEQMRAKRISKMMSGNLHDPYTYERIRTEANKMDEQISRKQMVARLTARDKIDQQLTNMLLQNIRIKMKLVEGSQ